MPKLAIVASHPIQYQAPWFRALADRTDLTVFFCHRQDAQGQADAGFGEAFEWDVPLVDGFQATWLKNVSAAPNVFRFSGCDTPDIADHLRRGGFDACIVGGWYLKSYLQAMAACWRLGIPVLLRGDSQLRTARSRLTKAAKALPYRLMLNAVAGHLTVGTANREYLRHYGVPPEKLFFVPHSIDDRWFAERAAEARASRRAAAFRREAGIDERTIAALFVGRLVDQKRPLDFVDAVAAASAVRATVGIVAGSGPLADAVVSRARERGASIRMLGFCNQSRLPELYAASDLLVLPSDARETWGLVVNEAMACGVPAVVSDAAGCAADMVGVGTGKTYPLGDVPALASAILEMNDLQQAAPEAVGSALDSLTRRFGAASAADATVSAVAEIVSRRSGRSRLIRGFA